MSLESDVRELLAKEQELTEQAAAALEQLRPVLQKLNDMCTCTLCGAVYASLDQLRTYHLVEHADFVDLICPHQVPR